MQQLILRMTCDHCGRIDDIDVDFYGLVAGQHRCPLPIWGKDNEHRGGEDDLCEACYNQAFNPYT